MTSNDSRPPTRRADGSSRSPSPYEPTNGGATVTTRKTVSASKSCKASIFDESYEPAPEVSE